MTRGQLTGRKAAFLQRSEADDRLIKITLEMARDEGKWTFMCLPLKRKTTDTINKMELGMLTGPEPTVTLGNIFAPEENSDTIRYDSFEAMVADGWRVN